MILLDGYLLRVRNAAEARRRMGIDGLLDTALGLWPQVAAHLVQDNDGQLITDQGGEPLYAAATA